MTEGVLIQVASADVDGGFYYAAECFGPMGWSWSVYFEGFTIATGLGNRWAALDAIRIDEAWQPS